MKKFRTDREKCRWFKGFASFAIAAGIFWITAFTALAAEGEITAETAYIRSQANKESEVVGSTEKGKKVDLIESVKDSAGMTWYKVPVVGGGYGYIRGDLVKTSDTVPEASTTSQTTEQPAANQPAETVPTSIGEQAAVIKCETNAIIRSGASKSHSVVSSLPNGTPITLIGEANDNAGNKWYQITANYNGRNIEGYIRSDLIAIGAQGGDTSSEGEGGEAPAEGDNPEGGEGENPEGEGQAPEETTPEPEQDSSHMDYEIRWAKNQDNDDYDYFLYDNTNPEPEKRTRMRLSEILNAATSSSAYTQKMQDQADRNKIIIIVLAGVIILLFVIITILIFKIRSLYYEDYDEDEEEEEEEPEPEPVLVKKKVRRKVEEGEEEPVPVRKKKPVPKDEAAGRSGERTPRPKREAETEIRAAERKEGTKKTAARKSQNFLVDDDEFEFEFLNMDDKDL